MTHLDALNLRLSNERCRLAAAKTDRERSLRAAWIVQIEREIVAELSFLGAAQDAVDMTDDELLAALGA